VSASSRQTLLATSQPGPYTVPWLLACVAAVPRMFMGICMLTFVGEEV
jgi:hypothetical protein